MLDNLHWCDQETLAFLTFCLGLATDAPVMVAATMRSGDPDAEPGLAQWLARMRAAGLLSEVALRPLEISDTATLAGALVGRRLAASDAELVQAATGGFPLSVVEAARAVEDHPADPLPDADFATVLEHRYEQLTGSAREVLGLAAAVGRDFTLDLLTEASDLGADEVVCAVDELWRRRILREVGDGYDFSHDLLRDAAYRMLGRPQRWVSHRRIAQGLELLHADDLDAVSAQLAEQYARGGRGERAVAFYRRAAEIATGRFAHAEAIRLHDAALSIIRGLPAGRDRDTKKLAVLEATAAPLNARFGYSSPRLREALEQTIALADGLGRRDALVHGLLGLWSSQFVSGDTAASYRTAARALDLVSTGSELEGPAHFAFGGSAVRRARRGCSVVHVEVRRDLASNQHACGDLVTGKVDRIEHPARVAEALLDRIPSGFGVQRDEEPAVSELVLQRASGERDVELGQVGHLSIVAPLPELLGGTSAVSVGPVRGRCAGCGAAPPRSRAPAASLREGAARPPGPASLCGPFGQGLRAGRGPARLVRSAPEPPAGRWPPVKIVE